VTSGSRQAALVASWQKQLIRIGRDISPRATHCRRGGPYSPSREFSFALHQIQQAIEPHLSLQQTLYSWNQIAQALAEKSRNRLLQSRWAKGERAAAVSSLQALSIAAE
jgi:hypothetical protein